MAAALEGMSIMSQHYSNPRRADTPTALPDVEVFYLSGAECREINKREDSNLSRGWYYWSCFPGCLPDSDAIGPFKTQAEAVASATEDSEDYEDE